MRISATSVRTVKNGVNRTFRDNLRPRSGAVTNATDILREAASPRAMRQTSHQSSHKKIRRGGNFLRPMLVVRLANL
ncbi:MAG: hypothetical protein CMJ81_06635 [Planctomycetaceae bacterium]|nr:hypothetical protein [Planctomycetaceae bacterium]MBP63119.1 hypothetical protein [Planctomycetaceae bacterium]